MNICTPSTRVRANSHLWIAQNGMSFSSLVVTPLAQTSASPNADPRAPRKYTFGVIVSFIAIALFLALFLTAAVLLLFKAASGSG